MRPTIRACFSLVLAALLTAAVVGAQEPPAAAPSIPPPADEITLEKIMADPDWIGNAPLMPYWADDGGAVYFERERQGEDTLDLFRLDLATGEARRVEDAERGRVDARGGDWSEDRTKKVYAREGDVFWKDVTTGAVRQLTRTAEAEIGPRFLAGDKRVAYRRGDHWFARDLEGGPEVQLADLQLAKDPATLDEEEGYLERQQERLFEVIRQREKEKETARRVERERQQADPTRPPLPFYLGKDVQIADSALSPTGEWLIVALQPAEVDEGKADKMPVFVTENGYVDVEDLRPKVGTGKPVSPTLLLLDLGKHEKHELDLGVLPGIKDDPLKELREKAAAETKAKEAKNGKDEKKGAKEAKEKEDKPAPRPSSSTASSGATTAGASSSSSSRTTTRTAGSPRWTSRRSASSPPPHQRPGLGQRLGVRRARLAARRPHPLVPLRGDRLLPPPPAPGAGGEGAAADARRLRGLERRPVARRHQLLRPRQPRAPGRLRGLPRVDRRRRGRAAQRARRPDRVRPVAGREAAPALPLATTHPPELSVQPAAPGAPARRLTDTTSDAFEAIRWTAPEIVAVPSTHSSGRSGRGSTRRPARAPTGSTRRWSSSTAPATCRTPTTAGRATSASSCSTPC